MSAAPVMSVTASEQRQLVTYYVQPGAVVSPLQLAEAVVNAETAAWAACEQVGALVDGALALLAAGSATASADLSIKQVRALLNGAIRMEVLRLAESLSAARDACWLRAAPGAGDV